MDIQDTGFPHEINTNLEPRPKSAGLKCGNNMEMICNGRGKRMECQMLLFRHRFQVASIYLHILAARSLALGLSSGFQKRKKL